MQSETADFALDAATWRTERNVRVAFDSGQFAPLCENIPSVTRPEVHNVLIALSSEEVRATATSNRYRKFGDIWTVVFRYANRQTDIQTP